MFWEIMLRSTVVSTIFGNTMEKNAGFETYTFIDLYSRKIHVFIFKSKEEVLCYLKIFQNLVENQCQRKIKVFKIDDGTEYTNGAFEAFLNEIDIIYQKSAPYMPEQNELAKRMNRTLVEKARCILFDAKLEYELWAEAINMTAHVINRSLPRVLKN